MYSKLLSSLLLIGVTSFAAEASLTEVMPDGYSFDQETDVGRFEYHDWTGEQLIDGVYGGEAYSLNLGNGNAYEWLGWRGDEVVNIDFSFTGENSAPINKIKIGVSQSNPSDVVFPDLHIFSSKDGEVWHSIDSIINPENSDNDYTKGNFIFSNLSISEGDYIRVSAKWNDNGPWTFIDEIDFYSVPAPGAALLLPLIGLGIMRRKQTTKSRATKSPLHLK